MPTVQNPARAVSEEHWPDLGPAAPRHWVVRYLATVAILALLPFAAVLVVLVGVLTRLTLWKDRS